MVFFHRTLKNMNTSAGVWLGGVIVGSKRSPFQLIYLQIKSMTSIELT